MTAATETALKFTIKKAGFLTGLEKAAATVSSKDNEPLLRSFNIEADEKELRILSTDLSLGSIAKIRVADIKTQGAICVPAAKLTSIVRASEDTDIEFEVADNQVIVKAGRARFQVNALPTDDYPEVPRFDPTEAEEVDREGFLAALNKVRYAASSDNQRANLMVIAFLGEKVVASDGARLQLAEFKGLEGVQIPIFAVNNLVRLLNRTEVKQIKVETKKNHLLFQIGSDTFSTQRMFDEFPDVEAAILGPAAGNDQELIVDKEAFLASVSRVRLVADEEKKQLDIVVLAPNGNGDNPDEIQLQALDASGELATETLGCMTTLAADRRISINHQYLVDAVQMSTATQLTFKLGKDGKARKSSLLMEEPGLKSVLLQLREDKGDE